jgi:diguanylate cyclase (GGDEF)-like protein
MVEEPALQRILVVDDDYDIARYVELNLSLEGFTVHVAHDGEEAMNLARDLRPDAVLLDVMMPGLDGYEVCKRLRSDPRTSHTAIIMLTAKSLSADTVLGLTAGADDYIAKPFDPPELVARVRAALRRSRQLRDISPLTGLPGNSEITRRLSDLLTTGQPFALVHTDLDRFKSFNDRYGFLRGDDAIRATADVVAEVVTEAPGELKFLGHVGGDDFVVILEPTHVERFCEQVIEAFDKMAPLLYDDADRNLGYIEVDDRRGSGRRVGIMTVSMGVSTTARRAISSIGEASAIATEMKEAAKQDEGFSSYRIDQRRG